MISLLLTLLIAPASHAFPQLSRHNYFNCTACHVSPSGGGDLTPYGHGLSAEVLSMKGGETESKALWGLVPDSEVITPSGFFRLLQLYTDNEKVSEAKAILMQADLGAAIHAGPVTAVGSVGRRRVAPTGAPTEHEIFSRTHYLMYSTESGFNIRGGKFLPAYGLNNPNHYLLVRRDTGLGNDTERYNAEASYLGDGVSILTTAIFGPGGDHHSNSKESGGTISVNKSLSEMSRLGASYYRADNSPTHRELLGGYGIISYSKNVYSQFEIDHQSLTVSGKNTVGFVGSHQLSWEVVQGITPYAEMQWENLDNSSVNNSLYTYGLGANFYPRPHFEFTGFLGREVPKVLPTTFV
ncbi:MAG: hypothetical protein ACXVC0_17835, partial [Bdellovibrionota bacterium]